MAGSAKGIEKISKKYLRDIPGWKNAPIPVCMGGDYRALSWCCKPGYSLTFGFKCLRDKRLSEIGLSSEEFEAIKEQFSKERGWDSKYTCFGSFSYCCMRRGGCSRRDAGFREKWPDKTYDEIYEEYAREKRKLAIELLKAAKKKEIVKDLLEFEEQNE